ncbi:unnamed protein product [Polarella glacialis]|uniref:Uncharacterized protein n=1 Tax=Polarella glacialis TaxID=89957 RepID=A0A813JVP1_POLGL|nr:unnamed protein product [Polarella glacialis]
MAELSNLVSPLVLRQSALCRGIWPTVLVWNSPSDLFAVAVVVCCCRFVVVVLVVLVVVVAVVVVGGGGGGVVVVLGKDLRRKSRKTRERYPGIGGHAAVVVVVLLLLLPLCGGAKNSLQFRCDCWVLFSSLGAGSELVHASAPED